MDDLDFLLLASHLFETRIRTSCDEDSMGIDSIATWLRDSDKLRRYEDTDPKEDVTVPLGDPRIMDLVNIYNPHSNIVFTIASESDALMIKRLRLQSSGRVTYRMVATDALKIPVLHGGRILVQGDVDGKHLSELVKRSPARTVMVTDIRVEGSSDDFDSELRRSLMETLVDIIYNTEDADMLGFSLKLDDEDGVPGSLQVRERIQIRGWIVESTPTSVSALNSQSSVK